MLWDLGDLAGARHQLEQALAITEAAYGSDHPRLRDLRSTLESLDTPD